MTKRWLNASRFLGAAAIALKTPYGVVGVANASDPGAGDIDRLDQEFEARDGFSPFTLQEAFDIACAAGRRDACERAQQARQGKSFTYSRAQDILQFACRKKEPRACFTSGLWYEHGLGGTSRGEARQQFRRACKNGYAPACRGQARLIDASDEESLQKQLGLYDQACAMGSSAACSDHALVLMDRRLEYDALV